MLIIQKPQNLDNYIKVNSKLNTKLQGAGYAPLYYDGEFWYYEKTDKIKKFVRWHRFV